MFRVPDFGGYVEGGAGKGVIGDRFLEVWSAPVPSHLLGRARRSRGNASSTWGTHSDFGFIAV